MPKPAHPPRYKLGYGLRYGLRPDLVRRFSRARRISPQARRRAKHQILARILPAGRQMAEFSGNRVFARNQGNIPGRRGVGGGRSRCPRPRLQFPRERVLSARSRADAAPWSCEHLEQIPVRISILHSLESGSALNDRRKTPHPASLGINLPPTRRVGDVGHTPRSAAVAPAGYLVQAAGP